MSIKTTRFCNKATVSDFTLQKVVKSIGKEDLKKSELVKSSSHEGSNIVSGKKRYVEMETRVVPVESSKKSNKVTKSASSLPNCERIENF